MFAVQYDENDRKTSNFAENDKMEIKGDFNVDVLGL
jgi:hypothetical protein